MKVTWFGGEPLLAPEIVESLSQRLIALADECGVEYDAGFITNGYLLDQDTVDMLARCKVVALQTTLAGEPSAGRTTPRARSSTIWATSTNAGRLWASSDSVMGPRASGIRRSRWPRPQTATC